MPLYETTFITRQDMSANDVDKLADNFAKIITDNGGKIVKKENWGLRNLAYPIKKSKKGHYVFYGIEAPFSAMKEMERLMGLNEDVLRNLTVKVDAIDMEPSAIMNTRHGAQDDQEIDPIINEEIEG